MRWLRRDEGIVMILVGVLLVVLLGMAGLAVDLGALYSERRQLRNGADAAALAIAEDCGRRTAPCDQPTADGTAAAYADANSDDGASAVATLTPTGGAAGQVDVVTSAEVRVPLMSLFGLDRVTVKAAATAIFDHPVSGAGMPLIIDTCEFQQAGGYASGQIRTLYLHPPEYEPEPCGGFGWLRPDGGSGCQATLTVGAWNQAGNEPECSTQYLRNQVYGKDVPVPLYSAVDENSNEYRVAGFALFHVTGYQLPSDTWPSTFDCGPPGPGSTSVCLRGYFTTGTIYNGTPGGPDYGVVLVKLIG